MCWSTSWCTGRFHCFDLGKGWTRHGRACFLQVCVQNENPVIYQGRRIVEISCLIKIRLVYSASLRFTSIQVNQRGAEYTSLILIRSLKWVIIYIHKDMNTCNFFRSENLDYINFILNVYTKNVTWMIILLVEIKPGPLHWGIQADIHGSPIQLHLEQVCY